MLPYGHDRSSLIFAPPLPSCDPDDGRSNGKNSSPLPRLKRGDAGGARIRNPRLVGTVDPVPQSREEALWAAEVEGLVFSIDTLEPAACAAVSAALLSLADDLTESRATRTDVLMLLALLETVDTRRRRRRAFVPEPDR
jgi:hypothetical protein